MRQALLVVFALCALLTVAPLATAATADDVVKIVVGQCPLVCHICPTTLNDWAFYPVASIEACLNGDP